MNTARLDTLLAKGTGYMYPSIRLADGHALNIAVDAQADSALVVCLWPGLEAPDTEEWQVEQAGQFTGAREFWDVPVQSLRNLIEQHGGEAETSVDDEASEAPLALLRAAGMRCLPDGDSGGYYVRIPLADGTTITFAGTTKDRDGAHPDVSTHHPVRTHGGWSAQWGDDRGLVFADVYNSHGEDLTYEEDTTDLVHAILAAAAMSGGSAPEQGVGETGEQLARTALAKRGITAHREGDGESTWLVIGTDPSKDSAPDEEHEPYILLVITNEPDNEWTVNRPPARPHDKWQTVIGDGTGAERDLIPPQPADRLEECVAAIADWLTGPHA